MPGRRQNAKTRNRGEKIKGGISMRKNGKTVLITEPIDEAGVRYLEDRGYAVRWGTGLSEEALIRDLRGCDAVLTRNGVISETVLRAAPGLRVVAMHGAGVDSIDVEAATRLGIQVTNAAGANAVSVAEFTIGLLIDLTRHISLYDRELRGGNWEVRRTLGSDLAGKTLGVVGMGAIGSLVAQKASAGLGMKVVGYRRRPAADTPCAHMTADLDELLQKADFVSLHVPLTKATEGLIGERELGLMKPGSYLVNTARGGVVEEEALVAALQSRRLAGAALDVFAGEIPAADSPLMRMKNVIVTPHAAAFSAESAERMALYAAMGVDEVLGGKPLTHPVNTPAPVSAVPEAAAGFPRALAVGAR